PQLSLFTINILLILVISNKLERVFSGGRRTISWERIKLSVSSIKHTECIKS
ncbi:hypothetical protein K458DRAFT_307781, partial [Lentithecium fluviatile CBS 122367]